MPHKEGRILAAATGAALLVLACGAFCFSPPFAGNAPPVCDTAAFSWIGQPINLNTASVQALCALKGMGEKKAQAVVEWRRQNGPFSSVAQLSEVKGISSRMVREWQEYLSVNQEK